MMSSKPKGIATSLPADLAPPPWVCDICGKTAHSASRVFLKRAEGDYVPTDPPVWDYLCSEHNSGVNRVIGLCQE